MRECPDDFNEQGLSNTAWAAAKLGLDKHDVKPIIAAVVDRTKQTPHKFNPQALTNMLWAAVTLYVDQG
eukprot:6111095-Amphidinium_carterae.1